jgi:hypothetical protein
MGSNIAEYLMLHCLARVLLQVGRVYNQIGNGQFCPG